ncbi:MAG: ABC transporter ATP-binding protein [Candidatus Binatia bacterium]
MAAVVVEGTGLGRQFASVRALRDLELVVRSGESLTIFGPNGAGKTTLVKLLATVLRPSEGELRIFGEASPGPAVRRRIGLVSHGSFLYGDLTAAENLLFYAELFELDDARKRIEGALDEVGLAPWKDRPVRTYSRGMEQRLALARAFLHDPDLILLDEPYSGLDPQAVGRLQEILVRLHRRGKTIVLTTHDISRGLEVCDHAVILAGGRMVWHSGRFVPGAREMTRIYEREVGK